MLPVGSYTLRISVDGSLQLLQGSDVKAKVTCPTDGICRVDANTYVTTYTIAGGNAVAGTGISQIFFIGSGSARSFLLGTVYAIGNVTISGTNPVATGESGVLYFAAP